MGIWLRRLAILAVLGFPLAVLGNALGLFDFRFGFSIIRWTVYLTLAVFVLGIIVAIWKRNSDADTARLARHAVLLSLLPMLGIGSQIVVARSVPAIHNITTDITDPPQFNAVVALRGDNSNPHEYDAEKLGDVQAKAYPELETLVTTLSVSEAQQRAEAVVAELGWELVASDESAGIVEATETTAMWGFKDDVVIRIRAVDDATEIDLRSVSRVGQSDLGANAKRILRFVDAFQQ